MNDIKHFLATGWRGSPLVQYARGARKI